jgi:L-serine dehydratase
MGPQKAAFLFLGKNPDADKFSVELYGSLALTGKGHLTDEVLYEVLGRERTVVIFKPELFYEYHPNAMKFNAFKGKKVTDEWLVFSVGGGTLKELNEPRDTEHKSYYPLKKMSDILEYTKKEGKTLLDYVLECEDDDILDYMKRIAETMFDAVDRGIHTSGVLPGSLNLKRRASSFYEKYQETKDINSLIFAATLAVSEENASGGIIVTAPTCGSSGVVAGVLYTHQIMEHPGIEKIAKALCVGGLIGNLVKHNASISGAEVGCQGEIGTASSMAAAALAYLKGGTDSQIEYAAEIALEHSLGMTCDPVKGYVQIPCIERNALSARRAIDSCNFAIQTDGMHYIDLDSVIESLKETGKDLHPNYRETSLGGLAKVRTKQ